MSGHQAVKQAPTRNRLADEKSPYLLQHARNPVDWYPWGDAAFKKAREENKPIFLSIGYSTCHWCHVMAHESFEDAEVARLMNQAFVSVKVDREERPDIDNVYMAICQRMTGRGGWPLTIIMTPDKKPFFAATYIPKESRFGRTGMKQLVPAIEKAWREKRKELLRIADAAEADLKTLTRAGATGGAGGGGEDLDASVLKSAYNEFAGSFDAVNGGFGGAPKFPTPHDLLYLLRYWKRTGEAHALEMVEGTLRAIRRGGIYDHVGGGFHRYSTDAEWLVPHFEKMLYSQALLAMAYVETYQATGDEFCAGVARETFAYVLRDLLDKDGAFHSAEDADSEGEEGKFYVWSADEFSKVVGEDAELAAQVFGVVPAGNFLDEATRRRTGANVLHLAQPLAKVAEKRGIDEVKLRERLEVARKRLFDVRTKRVRPHLDDKVLTDWNGLMIAALAKGARALDEPEYAKAAARAADFILTNMRREDGRLLHRWRDGEAAIGGYVDDYAFFAWGLLELYEATFDAAYLTKSVELTRAMLEHFGDDKAGGGSLFFTADDAPKTLVRQKETHDGAVPSGNAVAALVLLRLSAVTGDTKFAEAAARLLRSYSGVVRRVPRAFTQTLVAVDYAVGPSSEVVIVGAPDDKGTRKLLGALGRPFIPNKIVLLRNPSAKADPVARLAPWTKEHGTVDGRPTAYVCRERACRLPTTDAAEMLKQLGVAEAKR